MSEEAKKARIRWYMRQGLEKETAEAIVEREVGELERRQQQNGGGVQ